MYNDYLDAAEKLRILLTENAQLINDIDSFEGKLKEVKVKASDRRALLQSLQFDIRDILCQTDRNSLDDVQKAKNKITQVLQQNNLQSGRVEFIVNVFSYAFGWTDEEKNSLKADDSMCCDIESGEEKAKEQGTDEYVKVLEEKELQAAESARRLEKEKKTAQEERMRRQESQQEVVQLRKEKEELEKKLQLKASYKGSSKRNYFIMLMLLAGIVYFFVNNQTPNESMSYQNNTGQQVEKISNAKRTSNDSISDRSEANKTERVESQAKPIAKQENNKNNNAEDSAAILSRYHRNITNGNYREAYSCTSDKWQSRVGYEGWAKGFATTVSSEVSNVTVEFESDNQVILDYTLKAVDNPGGTKYFNGRAIMVKTSSGWKIDDMKHTAK